MREIFEHILISLLLKFLLFCHSLKMINVETSRIIIFVIPNLNIYLCAAMSFIHIYELRRSFRHIEKLTLRCVHSKNAVEYIYIYI